MSGEHGVVDALADLEVIAASLDEPRHFSVIFDRHAGVVFRFLFRRVGRDIGPGGADELAGSLNLGRLGDHRKQDPQYRVARNRRR